MTSLPRLAAILTTLHLAGVATFGSEKRDAGERVTQTIAVAPCWAGHPVGFGLLTHASRQYVAFYDSERRMTVAARALTSETWEFARLSETVGWDSHNSVTMAVDDDGFLHVSGNMHASPLVYFRSAKPHDIQSFERISPMVGDNERRATYPAFLRGPKNELILSYRDGLSGSGIQIYNVYSLRAKTWKRLLDSPLTDGQGTRSTYINGPTLGPDGYYHIVFVWRGQHGAELNHDLSYARSKDLVAWEKSGGTPLPLPIRHDTAEIVDPVPVRGGMINGNTILGFDSKRRVILSYHKFDEHGNTQVYNARREADGWKIYRTSDWNHRWEFGGFGSIEFQIKLQGVVLGSDGRLTQRYWHKRLGEGLWVLDEPTLARKATLPAPPAWPPELAKVESSFPGMHVRWAKDLGTAAEPGVRYVLRWETLGENRDRPRDPPWPEPSALRVYRLITTP